MQAEEQVIAVVEEIEAAGISTTSFAVALPPAIVQGWDEPSASADQTTLLPLEKGVVGTITFLGQSSVLVWLGWGYLMPAANASSISQSATFNMGPLLVAMPGRAYAGAFGNDGAMTSKLIGGDENEELTARQMSQRLSQKLQRSVLVSCSWQNAPSQLMDGVDVEMVQHKAAAVAEKEVFRIVQRKAKASNAVL